MIICWKGDHMTRKWKKWGQHLVKLFGITFFLISVYFSYALLLDTIYFKPIKKEIAVDSVGSYYKTALFYTRVRDTEGNGFTIYDGVRFKEGEKIRIIYVPHSDTILYFERID
jgi:hypothetical protein